MGDAGQGSRMIVFYAKGKDQSLDQLGITCEGRMIEKRILIGIGSTQNDLPPDAVGGRKLQEISQHRPDLPIGDRLRGIIRRLDMKGVITDQENLPEQKGVKGALFKKLGVYFIFM